jgi:hypothetical protein
MEGDVVQAVVGRNKGAESVEVHNYVAERYLRISHLPELNNRRSSVWAEKIFCSDVTHCLLAVRCVAILLQASRFMQVRTSIAVSKTSEKAKRTRSVAKCDYKETRINAERCSAGVMVFQMS